MNGSINEASESSKLLATVTVCISINIYCCKHSISLCYLFLALQGHNSKFLFVCLFFRRSTASTRNILVKQDQICICGVAETMKRWQRVHISKGGNQTYGHRKIPLTLISVLQPPSGPVSKTGRCEVVFLSRWGTIYY